MPSKNTAPAWQSIAELADQCVMCGLCLPHCPTYRVQRKESESPRGRIALAQALARGQLSEPQTALEPLDHCLGCLSCEGVCPAQVRYGDLIAQTRAQLPSAGSRLTRGVRRLVASPSAIRIGSVAHRVWSRLGTPTWFLPAALAKLASGVPKAESTATPARTDAAKRWLFSGCASSAIDQPAREAAAQVLAALGINVTAHPLTGCCGQLHRLAGQAQRGDDLAARLATRLDQAGVEQLISVGSGCYGQLARAAGESRVVDLGQLLLESGLHRRAFRPLSRRVQLHLPCSQRSEVKDTQSWRRLLECIPGLELVPMASGPSCCGAAGTHCLEQPATAAALRDELLDSLAADAPVLLTTNPGCAMYLRAGLAVSGRLVRVAHPVQVLAEQLLELDCERED